MTQSQSPFFRLLPLELRTEIYNYALIKASPINLSPRRPFLEITEEQQGVGSGSWRVGWWRRWGWGGRRAGAVAERDRERERERERESERRRSANLAYTCQACYEESTAIFYNKNKFAIENFGDLALFIRQIQPIHAQTIRDIHVSEIGATFPSIAAATLQLRHTTGLTGLRVLRISNVGASYREERQLSYRYLRNFVRCVRHLGSLETIILRSMLSPTCRGRMAFFNTHPTTEILGWSYSVEIHVPGEGSLLLTESMQRIHRPIFPVKERGRKGDDQILEEGMALFQAEIGLLELMH